MKTTASIPWWPTSVSPTVAPGPCTTRTSPAGAPASRKSRSITPSDERRQLGRLQDDGVPGGDRRRSLAERQPDREVPRGDDRRRPRAARSCTAATLVQQDGWRNGRRRGASTRLEPSARASRAPRRRRTGRGCTPRRAACPSRRRSRWPARGRRRRSRARRVAAATARSASGVLAQRSWAARASGDGLARPPPGSVTGDLAERRAASPDRPGRGRRSRRSEGDAHRAHRSGPVAAHARGSSAATSRAVDADRA